MSSVLQGYIDKLNEADSPILGLLSWYSIPSSAEIQHKEFLKLIDDHKAPIAKVSAPSESNVFRRACSSLKLRKQPGPEKDISCNYEFRDASHDKTHIYKCIVEEQVDKDEHTLDHRTIADISFGKTTGKITVREKIGSDDYASDAMKDMVNQMRWFINDKKTKIHDQIIRSCANKTLEGSINSVRVRPGGVVYFVAKEQAEDLAAVDAVMNAIDGVEFHVLPLVDDEKQRSMLGNAIQTESLDKIQELMAEISFALSPDESLSSNKFIDIQQRYANVRDKAETYGNLLDTSLTEVKTSLELCNKQMAALAKKEME